jgi:L,D-transpeptidase catalytic domain
MVVINLITAMICFTAQDNIEKCYPVLFGKDTPRGEFVINKRITNSSGYGGDVLQFKEDSTGVFAIHRLYTKNKNEKREHRLKSINVNDRKITKGCVNVDEAVYNELVNCCSRNERLIIK